ncbi:hypothetical protein B0I29_105286 [Actinoplanes lutulentus]|uniref:DUF5666 domain-containing protein n=1 Tax=Actinoplanes lutulentus TaxID=1287878 RepID=A0A327ZDI5_9ACTN|nr:hypothetical protein B0I29_105286 [Actinoplanes lutulentus]
MVLALGGCAGGGVAEAVPDSGLESVALQAAGFAEGLDEVEPSPSEAEGPRPRAIRKLLRKNTLHGEVVVQGRDGEQRTIVVQRGEVTAADDAGFTVKSTDGFELTWTFGEPLRVVQDRKKAERSAVKAGVQVAVGGARDGSVTAARLVVVR